MGRLSGKTAIVTGGARGMGGATSRRFVEEGAKVAICDVLEADGKALAAELGSNAKFYKLDVTSADSWAGVVKAVEADLGPVDVLVNNAGVIIMKGIFELTHEEYERVLKVNLHGPFLGIQAVGPGMVKRGKGSIVNISSVDGMRGSNALAAYASSKWGLRGLTRVAAMELGHKGVRVNSVHPGGIDTKMGNPMDASRKDLDKLYTMIPAQRVGDPVEVANASLFLASDEASYVMGAEIVVDGGYIAGGYFENFSGAPGT
jgi:3alpha(or 20beta)-hydroxysteroid dehydrogenase